MISRRVPNGAPGPPHRDVGVAAEAPLLHVAVADAEPDDERVQRARVLDRLGARAHVGLGDDLEQRRAGPVQVDRRPVALEVERPARPDLAVAADAVQRLAGVLLEVGAGQVDAMGDVADEELDAAALDDRRLVLADLVALRQVGVEVVLAREDRHRRDRRADRQAEADRPLDGAAIGDRQRAGQGEIDRRRLRVRRGAERGRRAAEDLRAGRQLRVGLDADHDLEAAHQRARPPRRAVHRPGSASGGIRVCQSVAPWKA